MSGYTSASDAKKKNNNPQSAYAVHILNHRHEYGWIQETMKLIKTRKEGRVMNWETFYIQILVHQQQGSLNDEQSTPDTNPLCTIAPYTRQHNDSITQSHAATAQFDTTGQHTHCVTYRVSPSYYYSLI
jgi:hypothetical protein